MSLQNPLSSEDQTLLIEAVNSLGGVTTASELTRAAVFLPEGEHEGELDLSLFDIQTQHKLIRHPLVSKVRSYVMRFVCTNTILEAAKYRSHTLRAIYSSA